VLTHRTPIFEWCRHLVARRYAPATRLVAYRDGRPAIHVRSIGEGAGLDVKGGAGQERLVAYAPSAEGASLEGPAPGEICVSSGVEAVPGTSRPGRPRNAPWPCYRAARRLSGPGHRATVGR
jgi:hypothetical protein